MKHELKLLTIEELAKLVSSSFTIEEELGKPFEAVDFAIADEFADQSDLESVKASSSGWYGIRCVDCGFDSEYVTLAVDYYGGGCLHFVSAFCGIDDETFVKELKKAISGALEFNDDVNENTVLICEVTPAGDEWNQTKYFATVKWTVEDAIGAAKAKGIRLKKEQAAEWWEKNQRWFAERLVEAGNEMLSDVNFEEAGR